MPNHCTVYNLQLKESLALMRPRKVTNYYFQLRRRWSGTDSRVWRSLVTSSPSFSRTVLLRDTARRQIIIKPAPSKRLSGTPSRKAVVVGNCIADCLSLMADWTMMTIVYLPISALIKPLCCAFSGVQRTRLQSAPLTFDTWLTACWPWPILTSCRMLLASLLQLAKLPQLARLLRHRQQVLEEGSPSPRRFLRP